ncbi:biotin-protein ligase [Pilaira anomala]|nr:biotin-protein ligase [Pilaira anomala]
MNVLIYNGNGTSANSVKQAYTTLKGILGHAYDVMKVDAVTLKTSPWEETCSLLVIPGGRDLPYCQDLNGQGNTKIKNYVKAGGHYLGFCAGGYYGSKEIEFKMEQQEIIGSRELGFFPGVCRGTMYPGFVYNSEKGARAVMIETHEKKKFKVYYNGGGYFVDAAKFDHVQVVCKYNEEFAAGVECQVGKGSALLFGVHPEYNVNLVDLSENEDEQTIRKELNGSLSDCQDFLSQGLSRMGLKVTKKVQDVPDLTPLYLSAINGNILTEMKSKLEQQVGKDGLITDSNDRFSVTEIDNINQVQSTMENLSISSEDKSPVLQILYPPVKNTSAMAVPDPSLTPLFDLEKFYSDLLKRRSLEWGGGSWYSFGNSVLYSKVITSTQTILDKNYNFAQALPTGLVCLATHQIAGRGRGGNSWVSQADALQFSFIVRHELNTSRPVVFVQYLIALAIVESIRERKGYEDIPLRVKWPNDIYMDLAEGGLQKVGGLLVNSSFVRNEFLLVIGCGVNLNNTHPTVSINEVIKKYGLPTLEREEVLAHALVKFEKFYHEFNEKGIGKWFLDKYYSRWLHTDKLVTLTTHDNEKARIVGITTDYGMLEAVSIHDPRKKFTLQPDGNSFDMLKGLIIKKN